MIYLQSKIKLYADDVILYRNIHSIEDCRNNGGILIKQVVILHNCIRHLNKEK